MKKIFQKLPTVSFLFNNSLYHTNNRKETENENWQTEY